jgi:hypothetical protein
MLSDPPPAANGCARTYPFSMTSSAISAAPTPWACPRAPLVSFLAALVAFHTARAEGQLLLLLNLVLLSPLVL